MDPTFGGAITLGFLERVPLRVLYGFRVLGLWVLGFWGLGVRVQGLRVRV